MSNPLEAKRVVMTMTAWYDVLDALNHLSNYCNENGCSKTSERLDDIYKLIEGQLED